jgi:hypothetical protein
MVAAASGSLAIAASDSPQPRQYSAPFDILSLIVLGLRVMLCGASIATSRRRRRAKTDKIDGETLVRALLAYKRGEPRRPLRTSDMSWSPPAHGQTCWP